MIVRPVLHTERLLLRPLGPADAGPLEAAARDADMLRWLPAWRGASAAEIAAHVGRGDLADAVTLGVEAGGSFAGECWLTVDLANSTAQAGYWLAPQARGRRYAAEALAALARWGFSTLDLNRIEVQAAEPNAVSQRVAMRAGFRPEGVRRQAGRSAAGMVDLVVLARLRGEPDLPAPRLLPDVTALTDGVVTLRPVRGEDAPAWYAERVDPDVLRWSGSLETPDADDTARRAAGAASAWLRGTEARFALLDGGADAAYAGHVSLRMTEPEIGTGEVGYALVPAARGRGLMGRALRLVGRWALEEVRLDRLEAGVGVDNAASLHVAEAAGFRREGVLRKALPGRDGRYDMVLLAILPEDLPVR